jgi:hypothetical protein
MGKAEGANAPQEIKLGSKVPILQHHCITLSAAIGLWGTVIQMHGKVPILARCNDCNQQVAIDIRAMEK